MDDVAVQDFKKEIGDEMFEKNTDYMLEYFSMNDDKYYEKNIDLGIVRESDGSFSVYEKKYDTLVTRVKKSGKKYVLQPMGILRTLSNYILKNYESIHNDNDMTPTIYGTLFFAIELEDENKLDMYLFYIGVIIVDSYQLEINNTTIEIENGKFLLIKGVKSEFITLEDNEIRFDVVKYDVKAYSGKDSVKVGKFYKHYLPDCSIDVTVDEIIRYASNEFRASKK